MSERAALADLLRRAQSAHHEHQVNNLGGKYSEDWPNWYAQFLVDNGIADFIARKPRQADLAAFLKLSFQSFEAASGKGDWANFVAGELLEHQDLHVPAPTSPEETPFIEREEDQEDDQGEEDSA